MASCENDDGLGTDWEEPDAGLEDPETYGDPGLDSAEEDDWAWWL